MKKLRFCSLPRFQVKLLISGALLGIFNLPAYAATPVNYAMVSVGDPGNSNDSTGFGAVATSYQIGKFEVTIGEYNAFLNAVASESDPYVLWNKSMMVANIQGISRSGSAGSYVYSVMNTSSTNVSSQNMPITGMSWFSAARFANWLSNGQPNGPASSTSTENGAYPLNGAVSGPAIARNSINPNTGSAPTFYIPTENQWYKAAFYNGAGAYYRYATQSNAEPSNIIGSGANLANFLSDSTSGYCVSQSPNLVTTQTYLTNVGTFSASSSHYGTFDQTGNVWEWTDLTGKTSLSRELRGGGWTSPPVFIQSTYRLITIPSNFNVNAGFRLAGPAR